MVAALATASIGMVAESGTAVTHAQSCKTLKGSVTISPGLTTTPHAQTATAKGSLAGCAPAAATGGSGALTAKLTLPKNSSCTGLATGKQTVKLAATGKWHNGKTSTMALTAVTGSGKTALIATITGHVTKGLFAGKNVTSQIKVAPKSGETCAPGHPVQHLTFTNTPPFVIG